MHHHWEHEIFEKLDRLSQDVVDRSAAEAPRLPGQHNPHDRAQQLQESRERLLCLGQAMLTGDPILFSDAIVWARIVQINRGASDQGLIRNLEIMGSVLDERLSRENAERAREIIGQTRTGFTDSPGEPASFIAPPAAPPLAVHYLYALLDGKRHEARTMILNALDQGASIEKIDLDVFQPILYEIGRLWQINAISVASEHYVTAVTQSLMSELYPRILTGKQHNGVMIAACIEGELHEVGMRMVADLCELGGWEVHYLGTNTPTEAILQILADRRASVLALSATMTFHVRAVAKLIEAVRATPTLAGVKILVGGYPFKLSPELWRKIGADGCGRDAREAVELARAWVPGGSTR